MPGPTFDPSVRRAREDLVRPLTRKQNHLLTRLLVHLTTLRPRLENVTHDAKGRFARG